MTIAAVLRVGLVGLFALSIFLVTPPSAEAEDFRTEGDWVQHTPSGTWTNMSKLQEGFTWSDVNDKGDDLGRYFYYDNGGKYVVSAYIRYIGDNIDRSEAGTRKLFRDIVEYNFRRFENTNIMGTEEFNLNLDDGSSMTIFSANVGMGSMVPAERGMKSLVVMRAADFLFDIEASGRAQNHEQVLQKALDFMLATDFDD